MTLSMAVASSCAAAGIPPQHSIVGRDMQHIPAKALASGKLNKKLRTYIHSILNGRESRFPSSEPVEAQKGPPRISGGF